MENTLCYIPARWSICTVPSNLLDSRENWSNSPFASQSHTQYLDFRHGDRDVSWLNAELHTLPLVGGKPLRFSRPFAAVLARATKERKQKRDRHKDGGSETGRRERERDKSVGREMEDIKGGEGNVRKRKGESNRRRGEKGERIWATVKLIWQSYKDDKQAQPSPSQKTGAITEDK